MAQSGKGPWPLALPSAQKHSPAHEGTQDYSVTISATLCVLEKSSPKVGAHTSAKRRFWCWGGALGCAFPTSFGCEGVDAASQWATLEGQDSGG